MSPTEALTAGMWTAASEAPWELPVAEVGSRLTRLMKACADLLYVPGFEGTDEGQQLDRDLRQLLHEVDDRRPRRILDRFRRTDRGTAAQPNLPGRRHRRQNTTPRRCWQSSQRPQPGLPRLLSMPDADVFHLVHRLRSHHERLSPSQPMAEAPTAYLRGLLEAVAIINSHPGTDGEQPFAAWCAAAQEPPCTCKICELMRQSNETWAALEAADYYIDKDGFRVVPGINDRPEEIPDIDDPVQVEGRSTSTR